MALLERGGDRRVLDDPALKCGLQRPSERLVEPLGALRRRLRQNVPGVPALEWCARERISDRDVMRRAPDELEAGHAAAEPLAREVKQLERAFGTGEADESSCARAGIGEEPQRRCGDDAERALGADEKAPDVVAGVVLAKLAQAMDHPSIGQDRLDPGHEVACIAVGDHCHAAGVGRDIAADGAGPLGGKRQRKEPVGGQRRGLRLGERHAGLADHHISKRIDLADRPQPLGRENDLIAAQVRRLAADEPGVAALRHNSDARLVAEGGDRRDLGSCARPDEGESLALIEPARFDERPGEEGRVGQHVARPDDAFQRVQGGVARRRVHPKSLRARGFALLRRKTAAISTCGEERNWSSGVTVSMPNPPSTRIRASRAKVAALQEIATTSLSALAANSRACASAPARGGSNRTPSKAASSSAKAASQVSPASVACKKPPGGSVTSASPKATRGGRRSTTTAQWLESRARSSASAVRMSLRVSARSSGPDPRRSTSSPSGVAVTPMSSGFMRPLRSWASARAASTAPAIGGANSGHASIETMSCERARMKPTSSGSPWGKRA